MLGSTSDRKSAPRAHLVSVPQWARRTGLASDGRSISTARILIAKGEGPPTVQITRRTPKGPVKVEGVRMSDVDRWSETNAWAAYLATFPLEQRDKREAVALRIVGDRIYVTKLYERFVRSQWRYRMTFEHWLKRRQRLKDKTKRQERWAARRAAMKRSA
jgi:hypothetical protein